LPKGFLGAAEFVQRDCSSFSAAVAWSLISPAKAHGVEIASAIRTAMIDFI